MLSKSFIIGTTLLASQALARPTDSSNKSELYHQCGGLYWTGATECAEGAYCKSQNPYYYQCVATSAGSDASAVASSQAASGTDTFIISSGAVSSSSSTTVLSPEPSSTTPSSVVPSTTSTSSVASTVVVPKSSSTSTATEASSSTSTSTKASSASTSSTSSTSSAVATPASSSTSTSTSATAVASSTSSGTSDLQVISDGFSGTGETTRYWDCCLPSYSWPGKSTKVTNVVNACDASGNKFTNTDFQSGCNGGSAYMCNDQTPWAISDDLAYGFAAASIDGATDETLACSCYKLTFTSTAVSGKSLVVQITNTGGDLSGNHFDLALPGGGFGIFTSGCPGEFGSGYSWGEQYGGVSSESDCANLPTVLQSGCDFRFDWFQGADNPDVSFEQVVCPAEIIAKSGCSRTDE